MIIKKWLNLRNNTYYTNIRNIIIYGYSNIFFNEVSKNEVVSMVEKNTEAAVNMKNC